MKIPKNTECKDIIIELVKLLKPRVYMELGVKKGYVFNSIAPLVELAIGVDCNGFTKETKKFQNIFLHEMTTDEFAEEVKYKQEHAYFKLPEIDLLFIDACHEQNQVLRDFDNFSKYVRIGTGIIILHDTCPSTPELTTAGYCHNTYEAAWEIRTNKKYQENFEIVTIPSIFGFSIIRKASKQLNLG